jgi:REP element-mobilizing transposase RayT
MRDFPQRKYNRLRNFDYSRSGYYFVTVCTKNREFLFGNVIGDEMILNEYGEIANDEIIQTNTKRINVNIEKYVIMPNHVHFIAEIVGTYCIRPYGRRHKRSAQSCVVIKARFQAE